LKSINEMKCNPCILRPNMESHSTTPVGVPLACKAVNLP
jgi:hypothetical protein